MENIWLDDERPTPEGWLTAQTAPECIELLQAHECNILSLDHDLGEEEGIGCGYDVLLWIEEQVHTNPDFILPNDIRIHTANASAMEKMKLARKSILKKYETR